MENKYVVQAWSNVDGWQNTHYSHSIRSVAERMAKELLDDKSLWISKPTKVRVVKLIEK